MRKINEELRAELAAIINEELGGLLEWEARTETVTLTDIEDQVLAARQRIGERLTNELVQQRADRIDAELPVPRSAADRPLHYKGKKTKSAKRGRG